MTIHSIQRQRKKSEPDLISRLEILELQELNRAILECLARVEETLERVKQNEEHTYWMADSLARGECIA